MDDYPKLEDIKRPLKKGEIFLVPCLVIESYFKQEYDEQELFMDLREFKKYSKKILITPVINHPHNDKENGQDYFHYHADFRFLKTDNKGKVINNHSKYYFCPDIRPEFNKNRKLEYILLPVINEEFSHITSVELIKKSKLRHNCIKNNKCPHRGFDLSQIEQKDNVITCPLHGLQFCSKTKKVINYELCNI
jgi:hypothetical protein